MNKKGGMTMLVVVGIAALIVGVLIGSQIVSPQFSPKSTSANSYVKAHSCDADGVCETNDLLTRNATVGNLEAKGISNFNNVYIDNLARFYNGITVESGLTKLKETSIIGNTAINGNLKITTRYLNASTAAYLCITPGGEVFAKATPCR